MGDRICVMKDGMIMQGDKPLEIYNKPANKFIAGFIGNPPMNFMEVHVVRRGGHLVLEEGKFALSLLPGMEDGVAAYEGKAVILGVRPEDVYDKVYAGNIATKGRTAVAKVEVVEPMGSEVLLHLSTGKNTIVARVEPQSEAKVGQEIEILFNVEKIRLFDKQTELRIL
jgi:multiple sugar transport system ATP-binding protein